MRSMFVTTLDNPFNYFTQFDDWYAFDTEKGYNTCSYVARIAKMSNDMSDDDRKQAINDAVKEIVRLNILGIYKIEYDPRENNIENIENRIKNEEMDQGEG